MKKPTYEIIMKLAIHEYGIREKHDLYHFTDGFMAGMDYVKKQNYPQTELRIDGAKTQGGRIVSSGGME